jgi:hypothetical protein
MTDTILNFSSNQSASNLLLSEDDVQTLVDASVLAAVPTFSNATNYLAGDKVYYLGIYYVAPVNINLGGGTPLANTTWRQIPTWGSYTTTATAAGTTTLDLYSAEIQRFSGVTTQTVTLPVVTTLPALGKPFYFINDSTGTVTVNSSGGNLVATILGGQRYLINNILLTGTTAASWAVASGYETTTTIGALISGSTAKTTLVDADLIPLDDSAASNILKNITWQNLKASIFNYTTTATAAGTTTLTAASTMHQFFTGATTQTVTLPVTSTLYTGLRYLIVNNSSGLVTVQSSGANTVLILAGGTSAEIVCILTSGTTAASWQANYNGVAVTSGKKLSASASITIAGTDGKTATFSNNLTFAGTDGKTVTFSNSITFAGTDSTTMTFPYTSASIARIDADQSFAGTQTFNGDIQLAENISILLDAALSADGKWSGISRSGVCGETIAFGEICYFKAADSRWWKTDSDAEATSGPVQLAVCVVAGGAGDTRTFLFKGVVRADSLYPALTIGAPVHLGSTAGNIQVAAPTTGFVRVVGYADTADSIYFNPSAEYEEIGVWTPSLGGSATYTIQLGYFRRINKLCYIVCRITVNVLGTGSATQITGAPFTSSSDQAKSGSMTFINGIAINVVSMNPYNNNASANFEFLGFTAAASSSTAPLSIFTNSTGIIFNITLTVA